MTRRIYLSGGYVSDWRERVYEALEDFDVELCDPRFKLEGIPNSEIGVRIYGPMDRLRIDESDIVFGYLEATNPTPINVIAECCYALGKGKLVILCDEWSDAERGSLRTGDWFKPRYLQMVRNWIDFVEEDFGRAIEVLKAVLSYEYER